VISTWFEGEVVDESDRSGGRRRWSEERYGTREGRRECEYVRVENP